MTTLQIAYNPTAKTVKIQTQGKTPPSGHSVIGSVPRTKATDPLSLNTLKEAGHDDGKVLYHHVLQALISASPLGAPIDMRAIDISVDPAITNVTGITLNSTTLSKTVGQTATLVPTISPGGASDQVVTWVSSNPKVARVNSSGVVTAVKAGTTTITATTDDGDFTATCVVTVS